MKRRIPLAYRMQPRSYYGGPLNIPAEEYGDFPDRSKNDAPAGRQNAEDAIHPERPAGASTTPVDSAKKTVVMPARGRRSKNIKWKRRKKK